jgi:2-polyprenyl-6-methoxyphenol hydroxylase-like FAD-dependent oxidoreductase
MTPNMGQGACQAIEDAVVLAARLGADSAVAAALQAYEARRLKRANDVVRQSHRIGQVAQWENHWAGEIRNTVFRVLPDALLVRQLESVLKSA